MRHFSVRPTLTLKGRKFKGLRGYSGKPLHPPLTDVPIAAVVLALAFDLISFIGSGSEWARDFYRAGTFVLIAGLVVFLAAALTGWWDRVKSSEAGTQARRTINTHALLMVVTLVALLVDVALRWLVWPDNLHTPPAVLGLTIVAALVGAVGATFGGSMVFEYGFNVETAGDHPVWHVSEADVMPDGSTVPAPVPAGHAAPGATGPAPQHG
ncbi:MAG: DUF2231 domain-containing protein [Acidimicrobiia bacterium]|nr:DUF2231 domain-containing protein [Acidimicrobiia bacterium]MCL4293917.1 DUF2231 domain-containing protein [Acidimicrobiia bacterium]